MIKPSIAKRQEKNSVRLTEITYLFTSTWNKRTDSLLKHWIKKTSYLSFLHFIANGNRRKHVRTSGNSGYIQDHSRWRKTPVLVSKLPAFKTLVTFVIFAKTSWPCRPAFLALFKLPDPGANIYVQSLLKFPTWGAHRHSKSPPHPVVPHPPSGITLIAALHPVYPLILAT